MIRVTEKGLDSLTLGFDSFAGDLSGWPMRGLLGRLTSLSMLLIKKRTAKGVDVEGNPFAPYSPAYALFLDEKGRSSDVNLFFRGHMLASMTARNESETRATIFFSDSRQAAKAHGHHVGNPKRKLPKREFFALNCSDIERLVEEAKSFIEERKGKHGIK